MDDGGKCILENLDDPSVELIEVELVAEQGDVDGVGCFAFIEN